MASYSTPSEPVIRPSTPPRQPLRDVSNTPVHQFDTPRHRKTPQTRPSRVAVKPWPRFGKRVPRDSIIKVTKQIFGYEPMDWQMQLFEKLAEGHDTMAIAGTGYGKSLVFALCAIAAELSGMKGTMLVVCPLKSLEKDQVSRFNMAEPIHLADGRAAKITAVVVNEDNREKSTFTQLEAGKFRLCYASPECLLRNSDFKQLFRREVFRKRLVAIAVDEAHLIETWKDTFRKDYGELEVLKISAGTEVPWVSLTATCSTRTFEIIYTTLGMGGVRPFWGIDMGSNRPNLALWVRPMEYPTTSMADLFAFVPKDPKRPEDFEKMIFYFKTRSQAQKAMEKCHLLVAPEFRPLMQHFTATGSEGYKDVTTDEFKTDVIRWVFATIALGVGLDVPNIKTVVVYGVANLGDAFQEGGRAGRDRRLEAQWVWIVEPWAFEPESELATKTGGKQAENDARKREKMDEPARVYINRSQSNECMREFLCDHFRPKPDLPGFPWYTGPAEDALDVQVEWVVVPQDIAKGPGCGCSAKSCQADVNIKTGLLTAADHKLIEHHLRKISPPPPTLMAAYSSGRQIRSSAAERKILEDKLYAWRDAEWSQMAPTHPFYCAEWVISDNSIERLVEKANVFLNADEINASLLSGIVRWLSTEEKTASLVKLLEDFRDTRRLRDQGEDEERSSKRRQTAQKSTRNIPQTPAPPSLNNLFGSTPAATSTTPNMSFTGTINFSSGTRRRRAQQDLEACPATPMASQQLTWKLTDRP